MYTQTIGYREPAYVSIMRKYTLKKPKKRISLLSSIKGRRIKKLIRRHIFKSLNRSFL